MNVNVGIVVVVIAMLVSFSRIESAKFYLTYRSDKIHCVCGQIRFDKSPTKKNKRTYVHANAKSDWHYFEPTICLFSACLNEALYFFNTIHECVIAKRLFGRDLFSRTISSIRRYVKCNRLPHQWVEEMEVKYISIRSITLMLCVYAAMPQFATMNIYRSVAV